jgi:hypothetical protein
MFNKIVTRTIYDTLIKDRLTLFTSIWIFTFFIYAELMNFTTHHFRPILYKPPNFLGILILGFILPICCHFYHKLLGYKEIAYDFSYFSFALLLATLALNACQLTPYPTVDSYLARAEFLPLTQYILWIRNHDYTQQFLIEIYNSLEFMLVITPFVAYLLGKQYFYSFAKFFLVGCMIGFTFYYFFPSCGPASILPKHVFLPEQHANHIKFWEIHHGIKASTEAGGLIAFPSFHVIWAWNCVRIYFYQKIIFTLFILWFLLTCISTVVLGWHYSTDVIGSFMFIFLIEYLIKNRRNIITN